MRKSEHVIQNLTRICAFGKVTASTMSTTRTALKKSSIKPLRSRQFNRSSKVTMQQYQPMVKQEQEKLILWRDSNTMAVTRAVVQYRGRWKKFSTTYRCSQIRISLLWFERATSKSTTRSFLTFLKLSGRVFKLERTKRKVSLSKAFQSGLYAVPTKFTVYYKEVRFLGLLPQRK